MSFPIDVIGIGADGLAGLRPALVERIHKADFLAGGERHLSYVREFKGDRFVIKKDLEELRKELENRRDTERCVVLASGDPLYFGIGDRLLCWFGQESLRFEPTVSSMQLAFARVGLAWQEAAIVSIHGRDLRSELLGVLGRYQIGIFSEDGGSPSDIGKFFQKYRCTDYAAWVAENLNGPNERITKLPLLELVGKTFAPLNIVILHRHRFPLGSVAPDMIEDGFETPAGEPVVVTAPEVRAVLVSKLPRFPPGDIIWDIGAGSGSVSVEMANARPFAEIIALERDSKRYECLVKNLDAFDVYNVQPLHLEAPAGLLHLPMDPALVFIGGSGGRLKEILDVVADRLVEGGRLLADFVTIENLSLALIELRHRNWEVIVTQLNVARSDCLGDLTSFKPLRAVYLLEAKKPQNA